MKRFFNIALILLFCSISVLAKPQNDMSNLRNNLLEEFGYKDVKDFQAKNGLVVDGIFGQKSYSALYKAILNVEDINFEGSYHKLTLPKRQIVWHHSAGRDNAKAMFRDWATDKRFHVATPVGIETSGKIIRGYDESFAAVHIGAYDVGLANYYFLEYQSVGVEVCNWGCLSEKGGKLYSWAGVEIPKEKAIELNYKGFRFYEAYSDAAIKSLKYWTLLNAIRFNIPIVYKEADMWQVSKNATSGVPGLYTHNSFVSWKSDVAPQTKLIAMAKTLSDYEK